jgi:hypothetical protein
MVDFLYTQAKVAKHTSQRLLGAKTVVVTRSGVALELDQLLRIVRYDYRTHWQSLIEGCLSRDMS